MRIQCESYWQNVQLHRTDTSKIIWMYSILGDSGSIIIKKPGGSETIAVDQTYDYNVPIEHM